jgi:hypothetical protein
MTLAAHEINSTNQPINPLASYSLIGHSVSQSAGVSQLFNHSGDQDNQSTNCHSVSQSYPRTQSTNQTLSQSVSKSMRVSIH